VEVSVILSGGGRHRKISIDREPKTEYYKGILEKSAVYIVADAAAIRSFFAVTPLFSAGGRPARTAGEASEFSVGTSDQNRTKQDLCPVTGLDCHSYYRQSALRTEKTQTPFASGEKEREKRIPEVVNHLSFNDSDGFSRSFVYLSADFG
jgi:hypothetical protein